MSDVTSRLAEAHWVSREDVFERYGSDGVLLLPVSGDAVRLNGTAAFIWSLLHGGTTVSEICSRVEHAFDQDSTSVHAAVVDTLSNLLDHGLVQVNQC